jgi:hypothetical protein
MLAIEDVLEILSVPLWSAGTFPWTQRSSRSRWIAVPSSRRSLLGIIPESEAVLRASNSATSVTICSGDSPPARAYTAAYGYDFNGITPSA